VERLMIASSARLEREWSQLLDPATVEQLRTLLAGIDAAVGAPL
jgi:hypothetical protein